MIVKRFTLVLALLALLTAGCQRITTRPPPRVSPSLVAGSAVLKLCSTSPSSMNATGLEARDALRDALLEGSTLSELITEE